MSLQLPSLSSSGENSPNVLLKCKNIGNNVVWATNFLWASWELPANNYMWRLLNDKWFKWLCLLLFFIVIVVIDLYSNKLECLSIQNKTCGFFKLNISTSIVLERYSNNSSTHILNDLIGSNYMVPCIVYWNIVSNDAWSIGELPFPCSVKTVIINNRS